MEFTPEIQLDDDLVKANVWARISANDKKGITIDAIKAGDEITITSASGICSFAESSYAVVGSIVAITSGILRDGVEYKLQDQAKNSLEAIQEESKKLQSRLEQTMPHKRRDAFGQDPKSGDYAKNEGGLIVCMPKAAGVIYATPKNRLAEGAKKQGRLKKYFPGEVKNLNSFFLSRESGGQMSAKAQKDGNVHILAFDQKFEDNAGIYIVNIEIKRGHSR